MLDLKKHARCISTDEAGSMLPLMAVLLVLMVASAGMALDFGYLIRARERFDAALDNATLAATTNIQQAMLRCGSNCAAVTTAQSEAQAKGLTIFNANIGSAKNVTSNAFSLTATVSGNSVSTTSSYRATFRPFLMQVIGIREVPFSRTVSVRAASKKYIEVTLVVDTSGSMAIGADESAQQSLRNTIGCAFACHDGVAIKVGPKKYADAYAYAKAQGITLRYDAINQGILALMSEFDALDPDESYIKASIWSFDSKFTENQSMTTSRTQLRKRLPTAPSTSGVKDGGTMFNEGIASVIAAVGKGGDGSSASNPVKLVIIASDGAQDPGRYAVWDSSLNYLVDAFAMDFCNSLQKQNVLVGVIHTPYIPMTWDWGYNATLGQPSQRRGGSTRNDDITTGFKTCAGTNYVLANDSKSIISGFVKIMGNVSAPHLTQ